LKIAVVTEDGISICQHFGRAPYYAVINVENGTIVDKETRAKAGHGAGGHDCHHGGNDCHGERHGMDPSSQSKHAGMMANILDCQVLIAGGMGYGAYESLKSHNIDPIITDINSIDEAVKAYLEGNIVNLMDKLH
jgi:predicted Fe-Mo cluster-binding NifX family protein